MVSEHSFEISGIIFEIEMISKLETKMDILGNIFKSHFKWKGIITKKSTKEMEFKMNSK